MSGQNSITTAELAVMQVLWNAGIPLKIQEVWEQLPDAGWKYNTVGTLLLRLEEKGAVHCEKIGKNRVYTPLLDKEDYTRTQTRGIIDLLYHGSVKELAAALMRSEGLTAEDIDDLRKEFDL